MPAQKFIKWKQKVLLGASLKVIAPTGQYDPTNAGRSNQNLAIPNAGGANGCLMGTSEFGSSP